MMINTSKLEKEAALLFSSLSVETAPDQFVHVETL